MKRTLYLILLLFWTTLELSAQSSQTVSGKVSSETGEPMPGVSIAVKGTATGTTTNVDGTYSLPVPGSDAVLVFSFIGYTAREVAVQNKTSLNVTLQPDARSLEEVIVTGYQTERKKDVTGAVAVVDVAEMSKQAVANPVKALQGRVAGMQVTGNGSPGAPATVRIRGLGTLSNNDPLYIIDGVPTKGGLNELNPADIESIQVLKDASSASIYGSRAANGVIIITTRRGAEGKPQVNANIYSSLSAYTTRTPMLDTEGYGRALWQAHLNDGKDPNANAVKYSFDYTADPQTGRALLNKVIVPRFLDDHNTMRAANTDWFKEVSRAGVVQNYDVSVSNGTQNGSYLFSLGYFDNKGVIRTTNFNRFTARLNSDYKLFNGRLTIGENLSLSKTGEVAAEPLNAAMQALPLIPVRTEDGGWGGPVGGMNDRQNPVRLLEDNKQNGSNAMRVFGNMFADVQLLDKLKFRSNFGIDYSNFYFSRYQKRYRSGYLNNPVNTLVNEQSHSVKTTWTNTLHYNYVAGSHRLDVIAGTELFRDQFTGFFASRTGFEAEHEAYMYLDAGTGAKNNGGMGAENVLLSYFGKANYSLRDRYLFSATLRYDGSSRFGQNNRFGVFPAFSAGWRLSEEGFIKNNVPFVDDLKLRFGWGKTGNEQIGNNAIFGIYATDYERTAYDMSGSKSGVLPSGYLQRQIANPDLRWEATTMTNLGLDFELFNQKLYGSAEAYLRNTTDILFLPPYAAVLGEGGNRWVNSASMENKGFELTLGNRSRIGKDLMLNLNGNFDLYRNKITKLPAEVENSFGGNGKGDNILGRPWGSDYGYVADGLFRSQADVEAHADQPGKGLGRIRYQDLNRDGVINADDRTWIYSPHPDFSYGLQLGAEYKAFDLSVFFQGISGIDVRNDFKYATDFWSVSETGSNKGARLLEAWSPENPGSDIPALTTLDTNFESRFSTYFVEKGSYLKVRNAQVGYRLDNQLTKKFGLQSLRVYLGGDNLGILLKSKSFTGVDPENPGYGYPNPLVGTAGFNIRF